MLCKKADEFTVSFGFWGGGKDIDIFQAILNKNYDVCYEIEKGCGERWANGELVNYNSGNVILYNHDRQVIYHIPYKGIKWLLPCKSKLK